MRHPRPPRKAGRAAMRLAESLAWLVAGCAGPPAPPVASPAAPPAGALALDRDRPIVAAAIDGVALRLRVDPGQWDAIELNPDAVARLGRQAWRADRILQIGRIALAGRSAPAMLAIAGRRLPVLIAEHGRIAADDADGVIGPDLLPYASVTWHDRAAPPATGRRVLALDLSPTTGLTAAAGLGVPVRLRFALMRPTSEATAAAGSLLAERYGGRFEGPAVPLPVLLGIDRPARRLRFDRAPAIAGFRLPALMVRIADFRGGHPLPADPRGADEIVVAGKEVPQPAAAWVTLAADRLAACADLSYAAAPRTLTLDCAFDP